jgi:D-alanyl-D-alanine carboxypeptidase
MLLRMKTNWLFWCRVCAWVAFPIVAPAGQVGPLKVSVEYGQPVLSWSNSVGQAYVIETTSRLGASAWEARATVTGDTRDLTWADDRASGAAVFYRVTLCTNAAPFQSLQQALERGRTNQSIVGCSAAVVLPAAGLWLGTSGYSHGQVPIRPQTRFEFASITKSFVAAAILRLAEEGRLSLEDTVGHWLPTLNCSNVPPAITIRQLLSHRSGAYNFGDDSAFRQALFANWSRYWQPEQVFPYVRAPYFAPDAGGEYSNTGYVLLGMIMRSATGATAAAELRRTVFDRAVLRSTFLGAEEDWRGELAHPHLDLNGDGIHEDLGGDSQIAILSSFWTSGAVISTPGDVARFSKALLEGGLLSGASLAAMRSFQPMDAVGTSFDYGLGLMRLEILGREHWAHSGGLFGEYAWFFYCPSTGVSMAVAYNYPLTNAGPNPPGELLIALANLAKDGVTGPSGTMGNSTRSPESATRQSLNLELPLSVR